jgi:hypothetical protein
MLVYVSPRLAEMFGHAGQDVSVYVEANKPIIAERPMYFDYNGCTGGNDVVGFVPAP